MNIKKSFVELVEFMEANKDKKVSSILDEIKLMCESKKQSSTVIKNTNGEVVAIYCYYHKQWELVSEVEYGKKANSTSGFNTMCKVGTSLWTKQQRDAKKAKEEILNKVASGEIQPQDISSLMEDIETIRNTIDETNMPNGFANEDDIVVE